MTILIPNLAMAGYRSFGHNPQYFERFAKINIFIGQNNAGKSNVLRFLHEVYTQASTRGPIQLDPLAYHLPDRPAILLGIGESIDQKISKHPVLPDTHRLVAPFTDPAHRSEAARILGKLFQAKARLDGTPLCWSLLTLPDRKDQQVSWSKAAKALDDREMEGIWRMFTGMGGGDRLHSWEPQVVAKVPAEVPKIKSELIPAIRQIGIKGSSSDAFDGTGIIERLAKLQNPDVHSQDSRQGFEAIQNFLREVIDRPTAKIEIPYERDTILVHMDEKVLPIESLGSGIHEVLILAAAATVLSDHVVCIEEPELHLNPVLQRKLLRFLSKHTRNQYFITTHSAALMDTPNAEVYHVRLHSGNSIVDRATSDGHRSNICEDLGYHPSDILQANCVIWVEGPSDRIYLNWWLQALCTHLLEGIHYSIMFYGGRLASHLSNAPESSEIEDFISLRRLNRRGAMLIDSDRDKPRKPINATKRRLQKEFDTGPGHAWISAGREVENYLPIFQIKAAISKIHPTASSISSLGKYDHMLAIKTIGGKSATALKVEIARYITDNFEPDLNIYDLKSQVQSLVTFILASNPKTASVSSAV